MKKDFSALKRKGTHGVSYKIVNILKLMNFFDSGASYTVKELAQKLTVTEKSVYRYLETLKTAYIPIYRDPVSMRYSFYTGYTLKKIGLTNDEISILITLKRLVSNLGIPFVSSFNSVLDKITYKIKSDADFNEKREILPIWIKIDEPSNFYKYEKIFSIISKSIKERLRLNMTYFTLTRKEVTTREVDPYGLIYSNGFWILVAFCHMRNEVRHFSIDSIRELEITGKYFFYPEDFRLDEHLKDSWRYYSGKATEVLVRFDKEIHHIILRRDKWHPTQKAHEEADGSVILSFTVAGVDEIKNWIYKFLPYCEVLSPPHLREAICNELTATLKKYNEHLTK